jgi:hypothetical protein
MRWQLSGESVVTSGLLERLSAPNVDAKVEHMSNQTDDWTILEGIERQSDRDGALFEWRYYLGSEQQHSMFVHISGTALAVDRQTLPPHVADAVTTHGRSAVEDALSRRQKPARIQVASNGSVFEHDQ